MTNTGNGPKQLLKNFKTLDHEINAGYRDTIMAAFSHYFGIDAKSVRIEHDREDSRYTKVLVPLANAKDPATQNRLQYLQDYDAHAGLPTKINIIANRATIRIADSNLKEITEKIAGR